MRKGVRHTINVAEAASLALLRVMKAAGPVYSDVTLTSVQTRCPLHGAPSADAAELEETIKNRTIISNVVLVLLFREAVHVVRRHFMEEVDILVSMELRHFVFRGGLSAL